MKRYAFLGTAMVCLLLMAMTSQLTASGLTLYSYRDERGQTIVVDSLERVPEQYRKNAERGFIPSFQSPPPPPVRSAVIESVPDAQPARKSASVKSKHLQVSAPPEEVIVDVGLASATLAMEQLRLIHFNNERILVIVRTYGFQHVSVNHLHLSNGQLILNFRLPTEMSTDPGKVWLKSAQNLFEQLKALQFNISRWITTSPQELLNTLPILLTRVKSLLNDLETSFIAIPAVATVPVK